MESRRRRGIAIERAAAGRLPADELLREMVRPHCSSRSSSIGVATAAEIESGQPAPGSAKATPAADGGDGPRDGRDGVNSARRDVRAKASFQSGQRVRARNINPAGHTRACRVRARQSPGSRRRDHGVFVFPGHQRAIPRRETAAPLLGAFHQHANSGATQASPRDFIHLDMWDDYLEHADLTPTDPRSAAATAARRRRPGVRRAVAGPGVRARREALRSRDTSRGSEWAAALADEAEGGRRSRRARRWVALLRALAGRARAPRRSRKAWSIAAALLERKEAWADAYRHTPHGKPIELGAQSRRTTTLTQRVNSTLHHRLRARRAPRDRSRSPHRHRRLSRDCGRARPTGCCSRSATDAVVTLLAAGVGHVDRRPASRFIGPWMLILIGAVNLWKVLRPSSPPSPAPDARSSRQPFLLGMICSPRVRNRVAVVGADSGESGQSVAVRRGVFRRHGAGRRPRWVSRGVDAQSRGPRRIEREGRLADSWAFSSSCFAFGLGGAELIGYEINQVALPLGLAVVRDRDQHSRLGSARVPARQRLGATASLAVARFLA